MKKYNYLTKEEQKMDRQAVNIQITMGLLHCKTKGEVCELLDDIRQHERDLIKNDIFLNNPTKYTELITNLTKLIVATRIYILLVPKEAATILNREEKQSMYLSYLAWLDQDYIFEN